MASQLVLGAILAFITLVQVDAAGVTKIAAISRYGSLNGGHRITVHGSGFAKNLFNYGTNVNLGNRVELYSLSHTYPCEIHKDGCTEELLTCNTVPMEEGKYKLRVWVDGTAVAVPDTDECVYETRMGKTPTINSVEPTSGETGVILTLKGNIMTTILDSKTPQSTNGETRKIVRVYFGPYLASPWKDDSKEEPRGIGLDTEDGKSGYIIVKESDENDLTKAIEFPANKNISFMVEDMGRSLPTKSALGIYGPKTLAMFQSYPTITSMSQKTGSENGGTRVTLTGMDCYSTATLETFVGGAKGENPSCDGKNIVFSTPPKPAAKPFYFGGRGVHVDYWTGVQKDVANLPDVLSLTSSSSGHGTLWSDSTYFKFPATTTGDFVVKMSFFFIPMYDGEHRFMVQSFGGAIVYFTNKTNGASTAREQVAKVDTDTTSWWTQNGQVSKYYNLDRSGSYLMEVLHKRKDTDSWVKVGVQTKVSHFHEDDTNFVRQEKQKVEITSTVKPDIQLLSVENFENDDQYTASQQQLDLQSLTDDDDFVLSLFGSKTKWISASAMNAKSIETALNDMPVFDPYNKPVTVTDSAIDRVYDVRFGVDMGNFPFIKIEKRSGVTLEAKLKTVGTHGRKNVHLDFGGVIVPSFPFNADAKTIKSSINAALGTRCPLFLTSNPGSAFSNDFEIAGSGSRVTDPQAFCGRYSLKNPQSIYYNKFGLGINKQQGCLAYRGTLPPNVYVHCDDKWITKPMSHWWESPADKTKWNYGCFSIADYKTKDGCERLKELKFSAREDTEEDFYIDTFTVMKDGKTTDDSEADLMSQRLVGALPGGETIRDFDVTVTGSKIEFKFEPNNCANKLPLIKPALYGDVKNIDTINTMTYKLGATSVIVTRKQAASPPVTGTYKLKHNTNEEEFKVDLTASSFESQLASLGLGNTNVEYTESCHNPSWTFRFDSLNGNQEEITAGTNSLGGLDAEVKTSTLVNGHTIFDPVRDHMAVMPFSSSQVRLYVNNILSRCKTDCSFAYSAAKTPSVTSATQDGSNLRISGQLFSAAAGENTVKIGPFDCSVVSQSNTEITCTPDASGWGGSDLPVTVNVKSHGLATSTATYKYTPSFTTLTPTTGSLTGDTTATITGQNLYEKVIVMVGDKTADVVSNTHNAIVFNTPKPDETSTVTHTVTVKNKDNPSDVLNANTFTYDNSLTFTLTSVQPLEANALGGGKITLTGTSLGGGTLTIDTKEIPLTLQSETTVQGIIPAMPPGVYKVKYTKTGQNSPGTIDGKIPEITIPLVINDYQPHRGSLKGGTQMTIKGKGFGSDASKVKVSVGETNCAIDDLTDVEIICTTGDTGKTSGIAAVPLKPSQGVGFHWEPQSITVEEGDHVKWSWSTPTENSKLDMHQTTSVDSEDKIGFTSGTPSSTGTYTNEFTKRGVYYYFSEAKGGDKNSPMRGEVKVIAKSDYTGALEVKLGDHTAPYSYSAASFAPPACKYASDTCSSHASSTETGNVFYFLDCCTSKVKTLSTLKATGDEVVVLTGERFGTEICQAEVLVGGSPCTVTALTDTQLSFKLNKTIVATVKKHIKVNINNLGDALMEENRKVELEPSVDSLTPLEGSTAGGTLVTVKGNGFHEPVTVKFKQQDADIIEVTNEKIICRTKSNTAEETVGVTVYSNGVEAKCGDICNKNGFRMVGRLKVTNIEGIHDIGSSQETQITVGGSGFGTDKSKVAVKFGSSVCDVTSVSNEAITCKISCIGPGDQLVWVETPLGSPKFGPNVPLRAKCKQNVWSVSPLVCSKGGGTPITVGGCGFSKESRFSYNGWNLDMDYNTALPCQLKVYPPALTHPKPASIADGAIDLTSWINMEDASTPLISKVEKSGDEVTVSGAFLSADGIEAYMGRGGRNDWSWTSFNFKENHHKLDITGTPTASQLKATMPKVPGGWYSVALNVNNKGYTPISSDKVKVDVVVSGVTPSSGSVAGGYLLTVSGSGLNPDPALATVTLQCSGTDYNCAVVKEDDSTFQTLKCTTAKFSGGATTECTVKVEVEDTFEGSKLSSSGQTFRYDVGMTPTVTKVEPRRGGTGGGTDVTITGTNFGTVKEDISVTIDEAVCEVEAVTDTEVTCQTGEHSGSVKSKVRVMKGSSGLADQENADFEYVDVWSSKFTWGNQDPPAEGEMVVVNNKNKLLLDESTSKLKLLLIQGASVVFDERDIELKAEYILITDDGSLEAGTYDNPFQYKATIMLFGNNRCEELPIYGCKVLGIREGRAELHGKRINNPWTLLDETANAGDTEIKVQNDVSDWFVGGELVIATTSHRHSQKETEKKTIAAINGKVITLTEALEYKHLGLTEDFPGDVSVDLRAEVSLLTRNVKFEGNDDAAWNVKIQACPEGFNTGEFVTQTCFQGRFGEEIGSNQFGAQMMFHAPEKKTAGSDENSVLAHLSNVEFYHVGQAFRLGRYPIHLHLNGDMTGSYIKSCTIHRSFNRAVNVHGVHNLLVEWNTAYNVMGGAYFLEDGVEINNIFQYNLAVFVRSSTSLLNDDITPASFWVTNPNNIIQHNHAAGGTHFGFWYRMHAHPDGPSFDPNICPDRVPLGIFSNNTAHSFGWFGLWIFQNYFPTVGGKCSGTDWKVARFHSLTAWSCEKGAEAVLTGAIQFRDFLALQNEKAGLESKFIGEAIQYGDNADDAYGFVDCTVIAKSQHLEDDPLLGSDPGSGVGVVLGYGSGSYYNDEETENLAADILHDIDMHTKFADDELQQSADEDSDDQERIFTGEPAGTELPKKDSDPELYPGARITLHISIVLILLFVIKHQLTGEALKDLLVLIELHCLSPNVCTKSLHHFYSFFNDLKSPVKKHYFCQFCHLYHGPESKEKCPTCTKTRQCYFMYIPLLVQLQTILSGLSRSDLQYNIERKKKCESNIEDVFDGTLYKHFFENGYFVGTSEERKKKEIHISFQFNTDGVSIFRSSSYSVWPLYITINELSPKKRFKTENRMFAGLWFGDTKPVMDIFLKPLVQELTILYEKGTQVTLDGQKVLLRAVLLDIVCDAPAKCLVQNFTQFNGFFGCGCCLAKGSSVKTSERGSMMSYPYNVSEDIEDSGHEKLRMHETTLQHARDAIMANKPQKGVKGFSVLCDIPYLDIIRSVTVDYMHCVLLGVQKMLLHLWTDSKNKNEPYYIGDYIHVIDDRLKALTPPNLIKRSARTLQDLKHWKASEYRSFLLFHSVCCLQGIMDGEYYLHFMLLVEAMYLLMQSSISTLDLSRSRLLLTSFCAQMDYLYSPRYETYNLHCLLHLVEKVKELGPLWCHSCFYYEDLNGDLRALFHGTNKIELQIASAVVIHQQLPLMMMKVPKGSEAEILYLRFTNQMPSKNRTLINNHTFAVGRSVACELLPDTRKLVEDLLGPVANAYQFFRLLSHRVMYHSRMYQNVSKRNSFTVKYTVDTNNYQFGQIQFFLKVDQLLTGKTKHVAMMKVIKIKDSTTELPCHFQEVNVSDETVIVDIGQLLEMCYYAQTSDKCFLGKLPVLHEN